ncbi:MAG: glycoside hydrolase family 2 protein [Chthonomonadales bacterium]
MHIMLSGSDWRILGLVPSEWQWRRIGHEDCTLDRLNPPVPPWIPAEVPGDVQSDLLRTGQFPDPWKDLNSRFWEWTSQRDWVYHKDFQLGSLPEDARALLHFEGVDYACYVFLNSRKLGEHQGTYTSFDLDATEAVRSGTNRLIVVVEHAPFEPEQQAQIGWTSRVRLWKPRFAYQWDWCTRLVPLGIHEDVWLEVWQQARLRSVRAHPRVVGASEGEVTLDVELERQDVQPVVVEARLQDPAGSQVAQASGPAEVSGDGPTHWSCTLCVEKPLLWYPNGYGDQPLYTVCVEVKNAGGSILDQWQRRIGFRSIQAVPNEGAPPEALPYTLVVNGKRIFLAGWNWAPIDQLYGPHHRKKYTHAIRLAKEAHCNLLRVWGGGLLEREHFYDLCDEAGILVWQEFPQSSSGIDNEPAHDAEYVAYCADQARQMVLRRAHHPSLALWCGGNELTNSDYRPLDASHPVLAALGQIVQELDPDRIYVPTSPSGPVFAADPANTGRMHDVHGNWLYMGDPQHYTFYNEIDPLLHSEFGCEGPANLRTLARVLSPSFLWPPDRTNPAWVHHGAWWINRERVEELFGKIEELPAFVFAGQWMQYEGLRYAVEASRRRAWRTSGCMPWQFNEAWPNTSCTNVMDYFGGLKPAYWAVRTAYAPLLVSARYSSLRLSPGETLDAEAWVSASAPSAAPGTLDWILYDAISGENLAAGSLNCPALKDGGSIPVGRIQTKVPAQPAVLVLALSAAGTAGRSDNRYFFSTYEAAPFAPLLRLPAASPILSWKSPGELTLHCPAGGPPLLGVRLDPLGDFTGPYPTWGYWPFVAPGETVTCTFTGEGSIEVDAYNAARRELEVTG